MFSLFTLMKPFIGVDGVRQRNAVQSWLELEPRPEIILLGDEFGIAEIASEFECVHIPQVDRSESGMPLLCSTFAIAQLEATHDVLLYVNGDILLTDSICDCIMIVSELLAQFLAVGRRWNVGIDEPIAFVGKWQERLYERVQTQGELYSEYGLDWFAFRRGTYENIPPFVVARCAWDNWLVTDALNRDVNVVDATEYVLAVHQGPSQRLASNVETKANRKLYEKHKGKFEGTVDEAQWILDSKGLRRR